MGKVCPDKNICFTVFAINAMQLFNIFEGVGPEDISLPMASLQLGVGKQISRLTKFSTPFDGSDEQNKYAFGI